MHVLPAVISVPADKWTVVGEWAGAQTEWVTSPLSINWPEPPLAYYSPFLRSLRQMAQRPWQRCSLHTMALYPWVWLPRQLQGQNYRILVTVADLSDIDKKQPPAFLSRRSSTPTRDELATGWIFWRRAPVQDLLTNWVVSYWVDAL